MAASRSQAEGLSAALEVWPPPRVSEIDPFDFGIDTGADGPRGRDLNPYVSRDVDGLVESTLRRDRAVVVSAPRGAGATRIVYEALNRLVPDAFVMVPRRAGEFDPALLVNAEAGPDAVLWMDKLGAQWGVLGAELIDLIRAWLKPPGRWFAAIVLDDGPELLASDDFRRLGVPVVRVESALSTAELDAMRGAYGEVATSSSIGFNPPLRVVVSADLSGFSNGGGQVAAPEPPAREHVRWLADEPVGLDGDELGRRGVALALAGQLRTLVREFPGRSFLVHLDGAWGAGKSTMLRFLRELVNGPDWSPRPADAWLIVSYDAWRQSRVGPPWLTLLHAVKAGVGPTRRGRLGDGPFWLRERMRLVDKGQWVAFGLMAVIVAGILTGLATLVFGTDRHVALSTWGDVVTLAGGVVSLAGALWLFAKSAGRVVSLDSRSSARRFLETRADPMEDLAAHFSWLLGQAGRPVLLLVDDLDRCPETFVVDLLDAVQKLMRDRAPDAGTANGGPVPTLLVVVAADGRWVRSSYDNAYASLADAVHEPGATIGTLFLEKLFQLTVPVPQLSDELKTEYLRDLLAERSTGPVQRGADPDLVRRLSDAPHDKLLDVLASAPPLERVKASATAIDKLVVQPSAQASTRHALEPYAALLDPTPRAMKRFVMAYSMLRAVRTAEGSVIGTGPLALWTILQTRWPTLASYLQASPEAVRLFAVPADRIPAATPVRLVPLFTEPTADLRAVMNHQDGPLDARTIRECSGQALGGTR